MRESRTGIFDYLQERYVRSYLSKRSSEIYLSSFPSQVVLSNDFITQSILIDGLYEFNELQLIQATFKKVLEHKTTLDIGANIGNHTRVFSLISKEVLAFEPNPYTFNILKLNSVNLENVKLYNYGASDKNCKLIGTVVPHNLGATSIQEARFANSDTSEWEKVEFDLKILDEVEELKNKEIGFIKIDVEGHELECLKGMSNLLKEQTPIIALEQEKNIIKDGGSPAIEYLNSLGYVNKYELNKISDWKTPQFLPKIIQYIFKLFESLLIGFPSKELKMNKIDLLENRDYSLIVLSKKSIEDIL